MNILVILSIALNFYVLWRLSDTTPTPMPPPGLSETVRILSTNKAVTESGNASAHSKLEQSVAKLNSIIEHLTERIENMEGASFALVEEPAQDPRSIQRTDSLAAFLNSPAQVPVQSSSEDWYWESNGEDRKAPSFSATDGFDVQSISCRSEWCRVEIEEHPVDGTTDIATARDELHLRINESLGRDTVIRWGKKEGNHRITFIQ